MNIHNYPSMSPLHLHSVHMIPCGTLGWLKVPSLHRGPVARFGVSGGRQRCDAMHSDPPGLGGSRCCAVEANIFGRRIFGVVWNLAHPIFQWIKASCSHLIGYLSGSPPLSDKPMSKGYVFPSNVLFQTDDATFVSQRQYLMLTRRMTRMTTMLMMSWHMKAQHEKNQYQSTCSWRGVALLSAWKFRATQIWDDSN